MNAIETLIGCGDEAIDWAIEAIQMWNQLFGSSLNLVQSSLVPDLGRWAGNIFRQRDGLSEDARIRTAAGNYLCAMVSSKSKTVTKKKMTSSIIELCFPILVEEVDDDIEDDDEESPRSTALQLLDVISISLPSSDVLPVILQFAEQTANGDFNGQRAALNALSVTCEGCADSLIEGNHVPRHVFIILLGGLD